MNIVRLQETDSTNTWVSANRGSLELPSLVYALRQTAGRGQRGNSWESEPGKNLCASALFRPVGVAPQRQFAVSEAVALSVVDFLRHHGVETKVKWPNDIYVADRKICGILIEHAVTPGQILYTIAGIGINLNQLRFLSDAPNPVSLAQLTGKDYDVDEAAGLLAELMELRLARLGASDADGPDSSAASPMASERAASPVSERELHREFMAALWRGDGGTYPFIDRLRGERIEASIADVAPNGIITLSLGNEERSYAFKEIEFVIPAGQ